VGGYSPTKVMHQADVSSSSDAAEMASSFIDRSPANANQGRRRRPEFLTMFRQDAHQASHESLLSAPQNFNIGGFVFQDSFAVGEIHDTKSSSIENRGVRRIWKDDLGFNVDGPPPLPPSGTNRKP
jgi:hypothetical protein